MDLDQAALVLAIRQALDSYHNTPMLHHQKGNARQRLWHLLCMYESIVDENDYRIRRWLVQPNYTLEERIKQGFTDNLVELLKDTNPTLYFNFLRMTHPTFEELLELVNPLLKKAHVVREPIPNKIELQLVSRYLASGDSQKSISYEFRVSPSSVCHFIEDVCDAIHTVFKDKVLKIPTESEWLEITEEYEELTDFPHCLGGADGKLVVIECPPHGNSDWYSYKGTHAVDLTATCDARYRFRLIEAGKEGKRSDGGIWAENHIKKRLDDGLLNIPSPSKVLSYE